MLFLFTTDLVIHQKIVVPHEDYPSSPSEQKRDYEEEEKYAILYQNGIGGRKYATLHRYPDRR